MAFKYHRGEYLEDKITGFKGVVVSRNDSLTGCNAYYLRPPVDKDGKIVEGHWVDEHALKYDPDHIAGDRLSLDRTDEQPPG